MYTYILYTDVCVCGVCVCVCVCMYAYSYIYDMKIHIQSCIYCLHVILDRVESPIMKA